MVSLYLKRFVHEASERLHTSIQVSFQLMNRLKRLADMIINAKQGPYLFIRHDLVDGEHQMVMHLLLGFLILMMFECICDDPVIVPAIFPAEFIYNSAHAFLK